MEVNITDNHLLNDVYFGLDLNKWNILNNDVNCYLNKFCIFRDVGHLRWLECDYGVYYKDEEDIIDEIVKDVANLIGSEIYKNNYKILDDVNDNKVYVMRLDEKITNLVAWKYVEKLNGIILRYGILGLERYIEIKIDFSKFLLMEK